MAARLPSSSYCPLGHWKALEEGGKHPEHTSQGYAGNESVYLSKQQREGFPTDFKTSRFICRRESVEVAGRKPRWQEWTHHVKTLF